MHPRAVGGISWFALGAAGLFAAQAAPAVGAAKPPEIHQVHAARELAGRDPAAARARLAEIRQRALAAGHVAARLEADEADCRILSDSDPKLAHQVAQAGADAVANTRLDTPARVAAMRLAACGAGAWLDLGQLGQASTELDALIEQANADPELAEAGALALLERGLHRSRRGELVPGQADLLRACSTLQSLGLTLDLELCHSHLANHYKRVGDADEALRLLEQLLRTARARNASVDAGVYLHGLAQIRVAREEWDLALSNFEASRTVAEAAGDTSGVVYAEYGMAWSLLRKGRAADAMPHAQRALMLLASGLDPQQALRTTVLKAMLHNELKQPARALADLSSVADAVHATRDEPLDAEWHRAHAQAQAQLGGWRLAYESLNTADAIAQRERRQQLSEQSARLRMQFNREKDVAEVQALRALDDQRAQLLHTQALALALFVALLGAATWFAAHKLREARRLGTLAMADELTGLPNRRAVLARLEVELQQARRLARPLSVLMIDADHFKSVNDTHGHAVGDQVLRHLAALLARSLRAHDWVGRLGGEEFLAVLPDATLAHTQTIAERMREAIAAAPCDTSRGPLSITVSIGAAAHRGDAEPAAALLQRADAGLYAAKTHGRNRVWAAEAQPSAA